MDGVSEEDPRIIDFVSKRTEKRLIEILKNPDFYAIQFLMWAYTNGKPQDFTPYPMRGASANDFRSEFDNGRIKAFFSYERTLNKTEREGVESLLFSEEGGMGRMIMFNHENGKTSLKCYKEGDNEMVAMSPDEAAGFLVEIGAPYKMSDPFPFEKSNGEPNPA